MAYAFARGEEADFTRVDSPRFAERNIAPSRNLAREIRWAEERNVFLGLCFVSFLSLGAAAADKCGISKRSRFCVRSGSRCWIFVAVFATGFKPGMKLIWQRKMNKLRTAHYELREFSLTIAYF